MSIDDDKIVWPSTEDCYAAMSTFVEYYMEGEQKSHWQKIIQEGLEKGVFPPGKGFLHEIDQVMKNSNKSTMPERKELYQLICEVCI